MCRKFPIVMSWGKRARGHNHCWTRSHGAGERAPPARVRSLRSRVRGFSQGQPSEVTLPNEVALHSILQILKNSRG